MRTREPLPAAARRRQRLMAMLRGAWSWRWCLAHGCGACGGRRASGSALSCLVRSRVCRVLPGTYKALYKAVAKDSKYIFPTYLEKRSIFNLYSNT